MGCTSRQPTTASHAGPPLGIAATAVAYGGSRQRIGCAARRADRGQRIRSGDALAGAVHGLHRNMGTVATRTQRSRGLWRRSMPAFAQALLAQQQANECLVSNGLGEHVVHASRHA